MSNPVNDVFAAFVEAQKAMQRLPEVETALATAQGEHSVTRERLDGAFETIEMLNRTLEATKASLKAKEDELSAATFRNVEVGHKLEMLLGTFKTVIGDATAVVELVEPKPVPVEEPAVEQTTDGTSSAPLDGASPDGSTGTPNEPGLGMSGYLQKEDRLANSYGPSDRPLDVTGGGESADHPTGLTASQSDDRSGNTGAGESAADPTPVADQITGTIGAADITESTDLPGQFVGGQGFVNPTETADTTQASTDAAPTPTVASTDANISEAKKGPYSGQPYWYKPSSMTWSEWISNGGNRPHWVNEQGLSDHDIVQQNGPKPVI